LPDKLTLPTRQEVADLRMFAEGCLALHHDCENCQEKLNLCALIKAQERLLEEAYLEMQFVRGFANTTAMDSTIHRLEAHRAR